MKLKLQKYLQKFYVFFSFQRIPERNIFAEPNFEIKSLISTQLYTQHNQNIFFLDFKGTVSVILGDPPRKDGNARFTTIPLKPLPDHKCGRYLI